MDTDSLFLWAVIGFAVWAAYGTGKNVGAAQERRAQDVYRRAQAETDPERKAELLLEWNQLADNPNTVKRAFKKALLYKPNDEKDPRG